MEHRVLCVGELQTDCYLIWSDPARAIVLDPGDEAERILRQIRDNGLTVQAVVLTHAHADHMLAAEAVCAATGAPLWLAAAENAALDDPRRNLTQFLFPGRALWQNGAPTPGRLLDEGDTIDLGGETLTVWITPGHTPGCLCLIGGGLLFSGDTLFRGGMGRIDFPGGDGRAMRRSLDRLLHDLPAETLVFPGHGPATTIERERLTQNFAF